MTSNQHTFTYSELDFPNWLGRNERYFQFEANGTVMRTGGVQKPTAVKHAERSGFGLVDIKDEKILMQPDVDQRLKQITTTIQVAQEKVDDKEELMREVLLIHGPKDSAVS